MFKTEVLFFSLLLIASFSLHAQQKIGYVDSKVILDGLQDAKDAQANLDNVVQQWKKELQSYNDSLSALKLDYDKKKLILTDKIKQEKEDEIKSLEKKIADYKQVKFGENGEYFQKQSELMKPVQDRIFKAIQDVAKDGGYDFVFDRSSEITMLYMSDKYDLTSKVIKKLETQ